MNIEIRKIFFTCAATAMCLAAHAASLNVGYCYGEIADEGISKIGKATIEGAIVFPKEMLAPYTGATITGIRVGLVTSEGVQNLQGWIRDTLEGDNIDCSAAENISTGWNDISLGGGLVLDGESLVAGFSFSQDKGVKCISIVDDGHHTEDARWIAKNGNWEVAKKTGVLSVELVITSDNLPECDLEIVSLVPSALPVPYGEDLKFNLLVRNRSLTQISGFDVNYQLDGGEQVSKHYDTLLDYGDTSNVDIAIDSDGYFPDISMLLRISADCDDDDIPDNNIVERLVGWYTNGFERRVLVEEFTTEKCVNCPRAINTLNQCINAGYGDRMSIVAHHVGFDTDWLTVEEDKNYLWFYDPTGLDGSYAPAVMLDRTVQEGYNVPVSSIGYFTDFEPVLQRAIEVPAFVSLYLSSSIEDDGNLNVDVAMEKLPIFDTFCDDSRVTVYLVEDNIPHHHQAGISSDTFTHSHVNRVCLTDIWGDEIEWNGNNALKQCSIQLDDAWNRDNLSVVAFVHEYDAQDVTACKVFNSEVAVAGMSGVRLPESFEIADESYYTLSGIKISKPENGLYLRKTILSNGEVKFEKIFK